MSKNKTALSHRTARGFSPRVLPLALAAAFDLGFATPALAADSAKPVFTLGEIKVVGQRDDEAPIAASVLTHEDLWQFDKDSLPDALNLVPGVASTAGAGNRNEALISVRGFDRWQVPLMLDGIRLFLPADNRIDFDRFLTPDLSEIQVSKGYVSVLNGPDGMGGSINLVSRKPVKPLEGEVRVSANLASGGQYNGNTAYASVGSRQEQYYLQASVEERDSSRWYLSKDYTPTVAENGGARDHTSKNDWRVNLKAGYTPNAQDEYSINYVQQQGEKHGIGAVTGTSTISAWDWPRWDTASLYWLSRTSLGNSSYLSTKAYYNTFKNDLVAYTNTSLTNKSWTSYYDDVAYGASVELGTEQFAGHSLKSAFHYRRDDHTEWQLTNTSGFTEPKQKTVEDIFSLAVEDTFHVTKAFDLTGGLSRDARIARQAQDYASNAIVNYQTANSYATNYQAAGVYRYSDSGKAHLAVSDRTRFPTIFERYSSRFGGATSNPYLKPERALNIELGVADQLAKGIQGSAAIFHNKVDDAIQSVMINYNGGLYAQNQNVGKATYQGLELALAATLSPSLELGGNYTYMSTSIENPNDPTARLTTTPRHKAFLYGKWRPLAALTVIPSVELASTRWSSAAVGTGYVQTGAYQLYNLKLEYQVEKNFTVAFTGRNLNDKNYQLVDGYPQEGRNFVLSGRYQF